MDFEPTISVFDLLNTKSCQCNWIIVSGTKVFILTPELVYQSYVDEVYFNL